MRMHKKTQFLFSFSSRRPSYNSSCYNFHFLFLPPLFFSFTLLQLLVSRFNNKNQNNQIWRRKKINRGSGGRRRHWDLWPARP